MHTYYIYQVIYLQHISFHEGREGDSKIAYMNNKFNQLELENLDKKQKQEKKTLRINCSIVFFCPNSRENP